MNESHSLSSQFLMRLREMQFSAWSRLVESFSPIVYAWCRRAGLAGHDAADVVQDVFATVARKIDQFDRQRPGASFRAWLATITRTRIVDYHRKRTGQPRATGGSDNLTWLQAVPDLEYDQDSRSHVEVSLIGRVLAMVEEEFEPRTWQAFRMSVIDNWTAAQVAEQLSISTASVYQARCRVLRRLKQRLNELPQ